MTTCRLRRLTLGRGNNILDWKVLQNLIKKTVEEMRQRYPNE